jgi:hypothetical protein
MRKRWESRKLANCSPSRTSIGAPRVHGSNAVEKVLMLQLHHSFSAHEPHPRLDDNTGEEENPNKWTFQRLGPGSTDAFAGVWEGVHVMYWAACHNLEVTDPFDAKLGQRYRYPTELPKFHEDIDSFGKGFANPFDILKLGHQ